MGDALGGVGEALGGEGEALGGVGEALGGVGEALGGEGEPIDVLGASILGCKGLPVDTTLGSGKRLVGIGLNCFGT